MQSIAQLVHALSFVLRVSFTQKRVILHQITPATHTTLVVDFLLCTIMFGNHAHETSDLEITHCWVTRPEMAYRCVYSPCGGSARACSKKGLRWKALRFELHMILPTRNVIGENSNCL